jgi:hypothetical protein
LGDLSDNELAKMAKWSVRARAIRIGLSPRFFCFAGQATMDLVLSELVFGSALLMRVPASATLLGYPATATVRLSAAGGAGPAGFTPGTRSRW